MKIKWFNTCKALRKYQTVISQGVLVIVIITNIIISEIKHSFKTLSILHLISFDLRVLYLCWSDMSYRFQSGNCSLCSFSLTLLLKNQTPPLQEFWVWLPLRTIFPPLPPSTLPRQVCFFLCSLALPLVYKIVLVYTGFSWSYVIAPL